MKATERNSASSKSTWPRTRSPSCDSGSASRGTFGVTAEVAARDKTIGDFESQAMNRAIAKNTPKWIRKIPYMYKPFWKIDVVLESEVGGSCSAPTRRRNGICIGAASGSTRGRSSRLGTLTYIKFGAPLILVSHLASWRGQPPVPKDERGMAFSGAVRDPNYGDYQSWSAALLTAHSAV